MINLTFVLSLQRDLKNSDLSRLRLLLLLNNQKLFRVSKMEGDAA